MNENQFLITQIQEYMTAQDNKRSETKQRTSFWATDCEKPLLDLYHSWMGTPPTNPIEAEKLMMFNAGKMMESSLVYTLNKLVLLEKPEEGNSQHRIEFDVHGISVSGYMDGLLKGHIPLEIKSFYGDYQTKELKEGKPRTSYLKQLATYMYARDAKKGKLLYIHRGTGEIFEFTLLRTGDTTFKCMAIEFDLDTVFLRWKNLYKNHVVPKVQPTPDKRYKYDIETLDWHTISKAEIGKARNNHKVIGDWECLFSPYLRLYLEHEGTARSYTEAELFRIRELTKGYTTWDKQ